ncbi:hypothetical protein PR048_031036 [Dryococelus australis]|uniref:Uncharacterized protein n=1 Tax=Dryococelus australis TaxID=614101 RepID=A0ABQ9G726_9NEOP|nr:hypothetical protein PR048_031036 [Dryococelus australis]
MTPHNGGVVVRDIWRLRGLASTHSRPPRGTCGAGKEPARDHRLKCAHLQIDINEQTYNKGFAENSDRRVSTIDDGEICSIKKMKKIAYKDALGRWKKEREDMKRTVTERLDCSPPTKANRVQSPVGPLPDFRMWKSCRKMPLLGGFSRGSPVSPAPCIPHFTLAGSQNRDVLISSLAHSNPVNLFRRVWRLCKNVLVRLADASASPPRRITRVGEDSRWRSKTLYILPQPSGLQSLTEAAWSSVRERSKVRMTTGDGGTTANEYYTHPSKGNRVRVSARLLPDFHTWESCRTMPVVDRQPEGFIGNLPSLHSCAAPFSPHFTLIGCQDLDIKSRSNLFTLPKLCSTFSYRVDKYTETKWRVVRPLAFHQVELGSVPEFLIVRIVPDDAAFLGDLKFPPPPCIPALLHSHLASPSSALKTSMLRAAQVSSLTHSLGLARNIN